MRTTRSVLAFEHTLSSRWHRLAFSVKGDSVSLLLDCYETVTKQLTRESKMSNEGLVTLGHNLVDEEYFTVSVCPRLFRLLSMY